MILNLVCSVLAFVTNIVINFFLSPYIVRTIGVEANGFITLANNFITYAALLVTALNSMASRFITIKVFRGEMDQARKYYSSVFAGNIGIIAILIIPVGIFVANLNYFIHVPTELVLDVKLLFLLLFLNFFLTTGVPSFGTAVFCKNKLYLQYIVTAICYMIRLVLLIVLFACLRPHVFYVAIAALTVTLLMNVSLYRIKEKIMPEISIQKKAIDVATIIQLFMAGIWNSISNLGVILINGLDLLISNIFMNSTVMGVLALAKTLPNVIIALSSQIANIFMPSMTIAYAQGRTKELEVDIKRAMKITCLITSLPIGCLIVFGKDFFSLWQPTQDNTRLYHLALLSISSLIFTCGIDTLWNVFTVVNRLKVNAMLVLLTGIVNTVVVFLLIKHTTLDVYAVAGVSPLLCLIRNLAYTLPFSAKYLGLKWNTFYSHVLFCLGIMGILCATGFGIRKLCFIRNWIDFFGCIVITCGISLCISFFVILRKEERKFLWNKIKIKKAHKGEKDGEAK